MGSGSLRTRREADEQHGHGHIDEPDAAAPAHHHPVSPAQPASAEQLSYLQSTGGNAMVTRMLQASPAGPTTTGPTTAGPTTAGPTTTGPATTGPATGPAADIDWIAALPGHIQGQIDMFQASALDKATGAKHQKLLDQRQQYREIFVTEMSKYLGGPAQVQAHYEAIHPISVGRGEELWVHDSTRERLMEVKADLEAKNIPMPATTVGLGLRGRHVHNTGGAGMMTHGLGFACDWKAYAAPHIKDAKLHTLFETVTGGKTSFQLEVGGKPLGGQGRLDLIEQMGQGTADADKQRQFLESLTSEYNRLKQGSADFKTSLPESGLAPLREVENRRTELNRIAARLKKAKAKDRPALQAELVTAQEAFEKAKAAVQANLATIFKPWLDELAKRGEEIEKGAANRGVDLRGDVSTPGALAELAKERAEFAKNVKKIEQEARKLLSGVRENHQILLREAAAIEAGLTDDNPDKATLLAAARQLLGDSGALGTEVDDLLTDEKPAKYSAAKGPKRTVAEWRSALDKAGARLGRHRTTFGEVSGPLAEARSQQEATADDIAARKERNAGVSAKVGKTGLAQLQADRKTLFWLDETARSLSTNIDFVLKSKDVADPGITQLLGLMSGVQGGGFFTPDEEQGGEAQAAKGEWSGTHGYNLEFFKAMVQHGFELGVAWDGSADTMHFELVEGRRLAISGGSRGLVAGTGHTH
ncbi:hypothetical protein [Actinoplanes sp. NPDC089786]|uniref:hypothetical protein n=1 Tax=Actinoplanes sp. NPDC089786 TaxID=3155185 RepID=UPI003413D22A